MFIDLAATRIAAPQTPARTGFVRRVLALLRPAGHRLPVADLSDRALAELRLDRRSLVATDPRDPRPF